MKVPSKILMLRLQPLIKSMDHAQVNTICQCPLDYTDVRTCAMIILCTSAVSTMYTQVLVSTTVTMQLCGHIYMQMHYHPMR